MTSPMLAVFDHGKTRATRMMANPAIVR